MDVLIEDATFVTMASPERSRSMLVRDGRIAAVGSAEAVRAQAGPGARVARLDGGPYLDLGLGTTRYGVIAAPEPHFSTLRRLVG